MSGQKLSLVLLLLIVGGSTITQCARPPPIICAAVLCAKPDCPYPLPPRKGECCPRCPDCPPTQVFNTCGSACTPTCERPSLRCTLQCVERCECPRNTVLNTATGKCVHIRDCPGKKG